MVYIDPMGIQKDRPEGRSFVAAGQSVVDALQIFGVAGIHSQHQILAIIDHCIFLLDMG